MNCLRKVKSMVFRIFGWFSTLEESIICFAKQKTGASCTGS